MISNRLQKLSESATLEMARKSRELKEKGIDIISLSLLKSVKKANPNSFKIDYNFADIEKGLEESVVMAVVLDHEDFFSEYEPITKTYLNNIQMFFFNYSWLFGFRFKYFP